jgi:hypothetical protein
VRFYVAQQRAGSCVVRTLQLILHFADMQHHAVVLIVHDTSGFELSWRRVSLGILFCRVSLIGGMRRMQYSSTTVLV